MNLMRQVKKRIGFSKDDETLQDLQLSMKKMRYLRRTQCIRMEQKKNLHTPNCSSCCCGSTLFLQHNVLDVQMYLFFALRRH